MRCRVAGGAGSKSGLAGGFRQPIRSVRAHPAKSCRGLLAALIFLGAAALPGAAAAQNSLSWHIDGADFTGTTLSVDEGASIKVNARWNGTLTSGQIFATSGVLRNTRGTAEAGDYTIAVGDVFAWSAGSNHLSRTPKTITMNRDKDQDDETFTLSLEYRAGPNPPPAPTLPSDIVVTIVDKEKATLHLSAKSVAEGGAIEITATTSANVTPAVTLLVVARTTGTTAETGDFSLAPTHKIIQIPRGAKTSVGSPFPKITLTSIQDTDKDDETTVTAMAAAAAGEAAARPRPRSPWTPSARTTSAAPAPVRPSTSKTPAAARSSPDDGTSATARRRPARPRVTRGPTPASTRSR